MKKRYEKYFLFGLLVLVILVMFFNLFSLPKNQSRISASATNEEDFNFKLISSGSTGSGDVSIELTPVKMTNSELKVEISVNTHSVDLSQFNLKEITALEYNGKTIRPSSVPHLRGHHSNGELVFNLEESLKVFTIKIKNIPRVEERIFSWP